MNLDQVKETLHHLSTTELVEVSHYVLGLFKEQETQFDIPEDVKRETRDMLATMKNGPAKTHTFKHAKDVMNWLQEPPRNDRKVV